MPSSEESRSNAGSLSSARGHQFACDLSESTPLLNYDILLCCMHFLIRKSDLLSIMRTCYALYEGGLPLLLRTVDSHLPGLLLEMDSFLMCISADPTRRGPMVRSFKLIYPSFFGSYDNTSHVIRTFAEVLPQLANLTALELGGLDRWFNPDFNFESALDGLSNIQVLCLSSWSSSGNKKTVQILEHLTSPIKTLSLSLAYDHADDAYQNLFQMLSRYAPTLESIDITKAGLGPADTVYPQLKNLRINEIFVDRISISSLLTCAPNLRVLSIDRLRGSVRHNLDRSRDDNILAQQNHPPWHGLDEIQGDINVFYALGLKCHVRLVGIRVSLSRDIAFRPWECILRDTRPSVIEMSVELTNFKVVYIPDIIPLSSRQNVTHFSFYVDFSYAREFGTMDSAIDHILLLLGSLPLEFLMLSLEWNECDSSDDSEPDTGGDTTYLFLLNLVDDHVNFIRRVAQLVPTLETMVLMISIDAGPSATTWKVRRSAEDVEIREE